MILVWLLLASPFSIPGRFVLVPCDTELNNTDILIFFFFKSQKTQNFAGSKRRRESTHPPQKDTSFIESCMCVCVFIDVLC